MNSLATQLEYAETKNHQVKLGTSSASVVIGALGFAGMAAVFTPSGPSLLLASVLTGGTGTAVHVSLEAKNYFDESQKVVKRILVLHGMLFSLLRNCKVRCGMILFCRNANNNTLLQKRRLLNPIWIDSRQAFLSHAKSMQG
jgi:hypothetical protein